ncbi:hypothetical protein Ae201684P_008358 [Aphanomyces euteiches]|uniref:Glycine zipper domain-containing protein n=1 Tax=Aphanomyces euteiches TaxID=100861 RepID=A0A6G0XNR4_9STRA|nr:hypothetical protein Ae201684_002978 [Aphanomyces euteiches]KAH9092688.1 hypothetical protein Ae201684P_008358 [Aphanomyces euteiches]KAH9149980.1 hypothetical protein AeRB84_007098 [Aphanomyces euteiches]
MRVLAPLALATSAVEALNLRGQDAPLVFSNQVVAPMHSPDDLRILKSKIKRVRRPKETYYREKGGRLGINAGFAAGGLTGAAVGSLAGPLGVMGGAAGGMLAGTAMGNFAGKKIGAAYGRHRDRKVQRKALKHPAATPVMAARI